MARDLVLDAYHSTGPSEPSPGQAKFDAALDAYHRSFPYVSKAVARQAVAVIIASMEDA